LTLPLGYTLQPANNFTANGGHGADACEALPHKRLPLVVKSHPSADDIAEISSEEGSDGWPSPCAFTRTVQVFDFRQITLTFEDADLPQSLRPVIESNEKLLKLYESGLPVWAIVMPYYGFYYRPWLRSMTWFLFYAFSVFSLAAGFYDLYKTLPGLQNVLARAFSALWLPAHIMDWLEAHTQIRLSILLTYLFGKSELFVLVMRWVSNAARLMRTAVQPVTQVIGPPLVVMSETVTVLVGQAGSGAVTLLQTAFTPLALLFTTIQASLAAGLVPIFSVRQHRLLLTRT
jgi:hypothetical protein